MSRLIGLTGGIGSGKSVVSRVLRIRGCHVYDCDLEARRLMDGSEDVCRALRGRWGEDIYDSCGRLDRRRVAGYVFGDDAERAWLDALVHGMVRQDVKDWTERHSDAPVLFVESAILCTSGLAAMCAEVWEVTAPLQVRIARLAARSGLSEAEARARIEAQRHEAELLSQLPSSRSSRSSHPSQSSPSPFRSQIINSDASQLLPQLDRLLNQTLTHN